MTNTATMQQHYNMTPEEEYRLTGGFTATTAELLLDTYADHEPALDLLDSQNKVLADVYALLTELEREPFDSTDTAAADIKAMLVELDHLSTERAQFELEQRVC